MNILYADSIYKLEKRNGTIFFITIVPVILSFIFGLKPIFVLIFFSLLVYIAIASLNNKQLFINIKDGLYSWKNVKMLYVISLVAYTIPIIVCILHLLGIFTLSIFR